jgi:predicted regulator of Ras-like GTPase activity (Roadblock/LC7/MglB family)
MAAIKDVLNKFRAAGVELAAVVSIDGMQIESYSRGNIDVDSVCAIATTGLRISEALGREIERGEAKQTVLEYESGAIVLEPLNEDAMMLVVSADPNSIGKIRYISKRYRDDLVNALNNGG